MEPINLPDSELARMIGALTCSDEPLTREQIGYALIELRELRRWWRELQARSPELAASIEQTTRPPVRTDSDSQRALEALTQCIDELADVDPKRSSRWVDLRNRVFRHQKRSG